MASKKPSLVQLPCAKTREFGEAEFSDCLPVSALVCVFAFDTGGLGLWLGAFGRSRLYRCQSVPGPPMPVFCGTELRFGSLCNLGLSKKLRFSLQRHKSSRIRHSPNSGDSLPVSAFASGNSYFINSLVQKLQNSAQAEFWDCTPVLAFETGILGLWLGAFGKVGAFSVPKPVIPTKP